MKILGSTFSDDGIMYSHGRVEETSRENLTSGRQGGFGNGFRIEASAAALRTGDYALRVKDGG